MGLNLNAKFYLLPSVFIIDVCMAINNSSRVVEPLQSAIIYQRVHTYVAILRMKPEDWLLSRQKSNTFVNLISRNINAACHPY